MVKKLSFYTALMLLIPIALLLAGWQWQGDVDLVPIDDAFYWLTETGSAPYALITCVLFMLWLMWLTRKHYSWLLIGAMCAASVIGTQAIKSGIKNVFAEPRPYVVQMVGDNTTQFYALSRDERAAVVQDFYKQSNHPLIAEHRANETGYSFPSGHTIFAVSWLLLFAGFLFGQGGAAVYFSQGFALLWAALMLISRLRLGMHYPIDLLASSVIAWLFHLGLFLWVLPRVKQWRFFQRRA